jgi:hypothetical protein
MTWLTWRQSRTELIIGGAALALVAVFLFWSGLGLHSNWNTNNVADCLMSNPSSQQCFGVTDRFFNQFDRISGLTFWLTLVPLLIGVLLAAPLVIDLEQGTNRLAWTQGVTRLRWLVTRIGLGILVAIVSSAFVMALFIWMFQPFDLIRNRFGQEYFDNEGFVVIAYTVFAFALCVASGTVLRRSLPAFALALVGFIGIRVLLFEKFRSTYLAPHKIIQDPLLNEPPQLEKGAWVVSSGMSDRSGHILSWNNPVLNACNQAGAIVKPNPSEVEFAASLDAQRQCFAEHDIFYTTLYHPANRFWIFQGIESAIFLGLSAILLGITFYWVMRRISR